MVFMGSYFAITAALLFWGASYLATALAYETIAPVQLGFVRSVLAAILFVVYRACAGINEKPKKSDWPLFAVSGVFGVTLYFAFQNIGQEMTSSSNAALVVASYPAITTSIDFIARRKWPNLCQVIGIVTAIAGVAVLTGVGTMSSTGGSNPLLGNILLIGAGVAWGLYSQASLRVSSRYQLSTLTLWQMVWGSLFLIPFVFLEGRPWVMPTVQSGSAILFLAVFCSLISFLCYNYSLKALPVVVVSALLNLMPIVGVTCSWLVLGEKLTWVQFLGGIVVIFGVSLTSYASRERG